MNVLWITNIIMPVMSRFLGLPENPAGGWMSSSLDKLKTKSEFKLAVATVYPGKEIIRQEIDGISYYLLPMCNKPMGDYNKMLEVEWRRVQDEFKPDVVHIHGTEFPHGLAWIRACGANRCVISIQGLVSIISRYYQADVPDTHRTFREIVRKDSIKDTQRIFTKKGRYEKEMISSVSHVIGRTQWDKSHCWAINPNAKYHFCGETLRDIFYKRKWSYAYCEPFRIFMSNGTSPIKGLHKLLEAMPLILRHYPETKVYVAGNDPSEVPWYQITGYGRYIGKLIKEHDLRDKVVFTGTLNDEMMCEQYLKSNLFICCSSIENSPNSLGEAQLLGMPYLTSFVGGAPDLACGNPESLYRFEEIEMLAYKACEIFTIGAQIKAPIDYLSRYDAEKNLNDLISIYQEICYGQSGKN